MTMDSLRVFMRRSGLEWRQAAILSATGLKCLEPLQRLGADGVAYQRRPAQQQPFDTQCLTRPGPQVEAVVMFADLAVAKHEARLDIIDHGVAGLAEQVGRDPMGTTGTLIAAHVVEGQGEVLGASSEYAPHVTGIAATQLAECRVTEHHVLGV